MLLAAQQATSQCHAGFTWEQINGTLTIHFNNTSTSEHDIISYHWLFGDGTEGDGVNPNHTYAAAGTYNACLIITDAVGCVADVCHQVVVEAVGGDCNAAFTWEQGNGLVVHFFDQSDNSPGIVSWVWNFGDGHMGDGQNPVHEYDQPGVYLVCLIVTNELGCVSDVCHEVTVEQNSGDCNAEFTWEQGTGLVVHFFDQSDNDPDIISWQWNFGDGHTSDDPDPVHEYAEPGVYLVCLIVENEFGCVADVCHEITVEGSGGGDCNAAFTWEQGNGLVMHFFDQSDNSPGIVSWQWNFGDGHTGDGQNPVHEYDQPGVYLVCLIVTNELGCVADVCHEVHVEQNSGDCHAAFTWEQGNGLVIHFIDQSDDDPDIVSWVWNFGDGHMGDGQNPVHEYDQPGVYLVCLIVTNEFGCVADVCHEVHVEENGGGDCNAAFTWEQGNGLVIHFIDQSDNSPGIVSWVWNFGDGHMGDGQNPVHEYAQPGVYVVCLIVTNELGCVADVCHEVHVEQNSGDCHAAFTWEQGNGLVVHFIDQSDDDPDIVSWVWNFGDGHMGDGQNPVHEYAEPGVYLVCLIVTNEFGCVADVCHEVHVEAESEECEALFDLEYSENGGVIFFINQSTGGSVHTTWHWDFGDGHSSSEENPHHSYEEPGIYVVCLTMTDSVTECYDDICMEIPFQMGNQELIMDDNIPVFRSSFSASSSFNEDETIVRYTNPVSTNLQISYHTAKQTPVSFNLYDLNGHSVMYKDFGMAAKGRHEEQLQISDLKPGLYVIRLSMDDAMITRILCITN